METSILESTFPVIVHHGLGCSVRWSRCLQTLTLKHVMSEELTDRDRGGSKPVSSGKDSIKLVKFSLTLLRADTFAKLLVIVGACACSCSCPGSVSWDHKFRLAEHNSRVTTEQRM